MAGSIQHRYKIGVTVDNSIEIFSVVQELSQTCRELYNPLHEFITINSVTIQTYRLNFEVDIVDGGFKKMGRGASILLCFSIPS
jgi:hypothetical protein